MIDAYQPAIEAKSRVEDFSPFVIRSYSHVLQERSGYFSSKGVPIEFYKSLTKTGTIPVFQTDFDQYALFRFNIGSQVDYGWIEFDELNGRGTGPYFQLVGYAYDTSGQAIRAGEVPEPPHVPLALSALSFGAIGVREWRKNRKQTNV